MGTGEHILAHPGSVIINGVPYQLAVTRSRDESTIEWHEDVVLRGAPPDNEKGLEHTVISRQENIVDHAWISEHDIDFWGGGMGDYFKYKFGTYHYGTNIDASEGYVVLAPLQTTVSMGVSPETEPLGFFEQGGRLYAIYGRYIRQINTPTGTPTEEADKDFGSGKQVRDVDLFNAIAVVALGNGEVFQTRTSGAAPGTYNTAAAGLTADFFTVTESFLYRAYSDGSVSRVAPCDQGDDPTVSANWGTGIDVGGNTSTTFTGLGSYGFQLMVARQDGLYRTNRLGFTPNMADEWKTLLSTANGRDMQKAFTSLYIPYLRGLLRYDGSQMQQVGIDQLGHQGPVNGIYRALTRDSKWLYGIVHNGTDSYVLRYKEEGDRGIWHNYATWTDNQITGMKIAGLASSSPTLWAASASVDTPLISRWILPQNTLVPLTDSAYVYATTGTLYMPRLYFGSGENTKRLLDLTIEADNLSSTETILVEYRTTGTFPWSATSPSWTTLATVTTSPTTTAINVSGLFLEVRLTLSRGGTTTKTPILRRLRIRALQTQTSLRHVKCTVQLPPPQDSYVGTSEVDAMNIDTPETAYSDIRSLSGSVTVVDPWGVSRTMYVLDTHVTAQPLDGDPSKEPPALVSLDLLQAP